jgi:hypothetical protein
LLCLLARSAASTRSTSGGVGAVDEWLKSGAPPAELSELPPALSEMFIYEAWKLIEADGDVTDQEIKLIEGLLARIAKVHENAGTGTKVAQIAIVKKPWRR